MESDYWTSTEGIPDTPAVIEFLATELTVFMRTHRLEGQAWTQNRVAKYVTNSNAIEGNLSPTTLGRILDPAHPQGPSPTSIRQIAAFLFLMGAIDRRDIDLLAKPPHALTAAAIIALMGIPDSMPQREFLRSIAGHYLSVSFQSGFLYVSRLIASHIADPDALLVDETVRLYRVSDVGELRARTGNLDPKRWGGFHNALQRSGGSEVEAHAASGIGIADSMFGLFLLQALGRGFSAAINLSAIRFDSDDRVTGFQSARNSGWLAQEDDTLSLPVAITPTTPPREVVRQLSRYSERYVKQYDAALREMHFDNRSEAVIGEDEDPKLIDFYGNNLKTTNDDILEKCRRGATPDDRLHAALEWGVLDAFREALAEGADANMVLPGAQEPLVFQLAKDGRNDWVRCLVETGRCDLVRRGVDGMRASHAPGVMARKLFHHEAAADEARRFADLAALLRDEEIRQISATQNGNRPAPGYDMP